VVGMDGHASSSLCSLSNRGQKESPAEQGCGELGLGNLHESNAQTHHLPGRAQEQQGAKMAACAGLIRAASCHPRARAVNR
jgi:hypothetical protein